MTFKEHWLKQVLKGSKTMEIRHRRYKQGTYFLGCKGVVRGVATFGQAVPILDRETWAARRGEHCVPGDELPYAKTYGLPVLSVKTVRSFAYTHPQGAVGLVRYRPE